MKSFTVKPAQKFSGEIELPGDKSISHRAVMISSISEGEVDIRNFLKSEDCGRTVECMRVLGIGISETPSGLNVKGRGLHGLKVPGDILYAGNSGTTIRLILGILAGQPFKATLTGDDSIKKRPMGRVIEPLKLMGARITAAGGDRFAPITIEGGEVSPIDYEPPVASAQVKSAILLAGLYARGKTSVVEKIPTRDHTERMLDHFGAKVERRGGKISITGGQRLKADSVDIPSDISSAAFVMAAACLIPGSDVLIKNVGVNPARTGIIDVLHRMGADIQVSQERIISGEPVADIRIRSSQLRGIELSGGIIPRIIDEIPVIAFVAALAGGETIIKDAKELRVKESDRITTTVSELKKFGAEVRELPDGMIIRGGTKLGGGSFKSWGDHRIAMACVIGGLLSSKESKVEDAECVETSFPGFAQILNSLSGQKSIGTAGE